MTNSSSVIQSPAFFLSDHAAVESGKLYTSGAFWNRFRFPSYPTVVSFGVAAILNIPWSQYHRQHKFRIWFEDADGKELPVDLGGEFSVGSPPDAKVGDETIMPISAMIGNFTLQSAGDYSAVLSVDGSEVNRWSFRAIQIYTQQTAPRPAISLEPPADE